jgi:two-component system sensor histidine kinase FlrB
MEQAKQFSAYDREPVWSPEQAGVRVARVEGADTVASIESLFDRVRRNESGEPPVDTASVEKALTLFDQLSSRLTDSYRHLEQRVSQLKNDLSEEEIQRQQELKAKEKIATRLSTLLEILPAGVVVLDGKGYVSECNPAALELLGEPLQGQLWLDIIHRSFAPRHDDGHEVSLKDGRRVRIETRSLNNEPGQLILLSDLTETRKLQEQVSRTERLSSLGRMVASLAHQIRTPLSTAMLYAGHLCQPKLNAQMRKDCAEKLLSRLTHLEQQIRDMLIFAKGETRLAERLSMGDFMCSLREAAEPVIDKAGAVCHWQDHTDNLALMCNKEALIGACLNLINNSIEAFEQSEKKRKPLELLIEAREGGAGLVHLLVKDNGPGIPATLRSQVFEPFYTTKPQGTGLGLAVVQAVVKAHKGTLTMRSSQRGLAVTLVLPVQQHKTIGGRKKTAERPALQGAPAKLA